MNLIVSGHQIASLRRLSGFSLAFVFFVTAFTCSHVTAQTKYTPDSPEVKQMADRAAAYLTNARMNNVRYEAVGALAVVQHSKRYNASIPKDNALVKRAIGSILAKFPDAENFDGSSILEEDEMYYPSVALILLCEVDSQKYKNQIKQILKMFKNRQRPNGSFTYSHEPNSADTSQTQFVALGMFVAKHHGFGFEPSMAKRALQWIVASQQAGGIWIYKLDTSGSENDPGKPSANSTSTLSMQAAGLGTAYLLADVLQLSKRVKSMSKALNKSSIGLPKTVSIYVPPVDGDDELLKKEGPLAQFDRGRLNTATGAGNRRLESTFSVEPSNWTFYYLYAVERYAYFREQKEGDLGEGVIANWYDSTIDYFLEEQEGNGGFPRNPREPSELGTSFALLVMVRSSEVINLPKRDSQLEGGVGLESDVTLRRIGNRLEKVDVTRNLSDLLSMMKEDATQEQLQELSGKLKEQIVEFRNKSDKDRGQIKAFLQSMVSAKNYFRRLIAIRFLAGEQDMDNVPALIYALGDPDMRICLEAHDGLRLISRKIDSISISDDARKNAKRDPSALAKDIEAESLTRSEFTALKRQWTEWFLKIRPDAELLD